MDEISLESGGVKLKFLSTETEKNQMPEIGQEIHVSYKLAKASNPEVTIFTNESFSFILGANKVIKGFELAIKNMKVGQKVAAAISSDLAYGKLG